MSKDKSEDGRGGERDVSNLITLQKYRKMPTVEAVSILSVLGTSRDTLTIKMSLASSHR